MSFARLQKTRPFLINASGFTLGQLLASLLIINVVGFFVYSFFLVLQQANSYARSGSCAANLKQVSLAILQYTADYDDRFPPCATAKKEGGVLLGWAATHDRRGAPVVSDTTTPQTNFNQIIGGYLKTEAIFRCPEVLNTFGPVSYMMNDLASGGARKDFAAPQNTVLVCDGENVAGNVGHAYDPNTPAAPATFALDGTVVLGATLQTAPLRHSDGANYGYADGHVKYSKSEAIYFPSRFSTSRSHKDAKTGRILGPDPAQLNTKKVGAYNGTAYVGTFHIN